MFTYDDLSHGRIRYIHEENELTMFEFLSNGVKTSDDRIDLRVSDGKNDATTSVKISIGRLDNQMPMLKTTYSMRVKELERRRLTPNEIKVIDKDTADEQLKIIITHPPQYGTLEKQTTSTVSAPDPSGLSDTEDKVISINTNTNQKLNFILKFNKDTGVVHGQTSTSYVTVNEFTMSDLNNGLISYKHRSPGARQDRFGFVVYDGYNNMFITPTGQQVSNYQIFDLIIDSAQNQPPVIEKNIGLDYLYQIDGQPGRLIMKNELYIVDSDDQDTDLVVEITVKPLYGFVEHKDRPGVPVSRFTQADVNGNRIYYVLRHVDDRQVYEDYFEFDVHDSAQNRLKQNRFNIRWSFVQFDESELSVMESEGKARVHIKKSGFLKQYSQVTCKTVSNTAKSNRDSKMYDFIHTHVRIEFNEDESYKACDVILNKDEQIEPIESFYVLLEEAKYSIVGKTSRIKVNILDKKKESVIEFESVRFEVHETDKFISLPVVRSGDLSADSYVECLTQDETAHRMLDYLPRYAASANTAGQQHQQANSNLVKIPAGEMYGFCDIEIIDDDLQEMNTETFKAVLVNPSFGSKIGAKSEAKIAIAGPNDGRHSFFLANLFILTLIIQNFPKTHINFIIF